MPTIHVPLPSLPANTILLKTVQPQSNSVTFATLYSDHWFHRQAGSGAFNIVAAALDFNTFWFGPVFSNLPSTDCGSIGFWLFANVGPHVQSTLISPSHPHGPSSSFGPQFCVTLHRQGISGTDFLDTYVRMPPVPRTYITGTDLNPTGAAVYSVSMANYMGLVPTQGWSFEPAVVSRSLNVVYPITSVRRCRNIRIIRKRRIKDAPWKRTYLWPLVP